VKATQRESIKLTSAALDDAGGEIILRGVLDPESLDLLKVDEYQREILPGRGQNNITGGNNAIRQAYETKKSVPDLDLGMRGGNYDERGKAFYLLDPVYIIDGLQRTTAAIETLKRGTSPHVGAVVHFNTTEPWERERFHVLNAERTPLSGNVLLRNLGKKNRAVAMLHDLCSDSSFVLAGRVCWNQRYRRDHLITGLLLYRLACTLHMHITAGLAGTRYAQTSIIMERLMDKIGRKALRSNVMEFWNVVEECWKVRDIVYREHAVQVRAGFAITLANIFNEHEDFWRDSQLFVGRDLRRKLALFSLRDTQVIALSSSSGQSRKILHNLMVQHINSGKRTKRLLPFRPGTETAPDVTVGALVDPVDGVPIGGYVT
jgi:hypothetical protein